MRHCCLVRLLPGLTIALFLLGLAQVNGQSYPVTLAWSRNREPDVAGYRLYYGTRHRDYRWNMNVGNLVTATVPDLRVGITYYFAVTAYNTAGVESGYSSEVAYAPPTGTPSPSPIPTPSAAPTPTITVMPAALSFSGIVGGTDPDGQDLQIITSTGVPWTSSLSTSPWFKVQPIVGPSGGFTLVSVHIGTLNEGTYADEIRFSAAGLPGRVVPVTLTVFPAPIPGIVRDDFDRTDGDLGPNWTMDASWGSGLTISGNKVVAFNSGGSYWTANAFDPDQYSEVRLNGTIDNWSGVIVRGNLRPAPFYLARVNGGGANLYAWVNGILVQLAHDNTIWATGDLLRLEVRTIAQTVARLTVYRNGAALFSYDDVDTAITGGQPGITLRSGVLGMSLDDWEGGGAIP